MNSSVEMKNRRRWERMTKYLDGNDHEINREESRNVSKMKI